MLKYINTVPFTYNGGEIEDNVVNMYYDVCFSKSFGVFRKGEKCHVLCIDFINGLAKSYDKTGNNLVKEQKFKTIAVEKKKIKNL